MNYLLAHQAGIGLKSLLCRKGRSLCYSSFHQQSSTGLEYFMAPTTSVTRGEGGNIQVYLFQQLLIQGLKLCLRVYLIQLMTVAIAFSNKTTRNTCSCIFLADGVNN